MTRCPLTGAQEQLWTLHRTGTSLAVWDSQGWRSRSRGSPATESSWLSGGVSLSVVMQQLVELPML